MLDICLVNSYLLWDGHINDRSCRGHRRFRKALCQALLEYPDEENSTAVTPPVTPQSSEHTWSKFQKRNYCHYCKEHKEEWMPQRPAKKRHFGTDITNIVTTATRRRGSSTWGGVVAPVASIYASKGSVGSSIIVKSSR
jgi:hypothetical protein